MFAASAAAWCGSGSSMPGMDMPGGWVMSMAWVRVPGQGWLEYTGAFLGMWAVMMAMMMAPAFTPMLMRYRRALPTGHKGVLSCWMTLGYFAMWMAVGMFLLLSGTAFAQWVLQAPAVSQAVPMARAMTLMLAGAAQFTAWKARALAGCHQTGCCREAAPDRRSAWRHGLALGLRCIHCCAGLTAALLVLGIMDLRAMALVTLAISAERLVPGRSFARIAGAALMAAGAWMMFGTLAG